MTKKSNSKIYKVVFVILMLAIAFFVIENPNSSKDTYVALNGIVENKETAEAVIIRDETIYLSQYDGEVKYLFNEGEKTSKGALVAEQYVDSDVKKISDKITLLNSIIESRNVNKEFSKEGKNNYQIEESELQKYILNEQYDKVTDVINTINSTKYSFSSYNKYSNEELSFMRKTLEKSISNKKYSYYSKFSGIVSYYSDNMERIYNISRIDSFDINDVFILDSEFVNIKNNYIKMDEKLIRIVNNYQWYFLCKINNLKKYNIKKNDIVKIRVLNEDLIINASIYDIKEYGEESIVIFSMQEYLYKFIKDRHINIEIIFNEYKGLLVKNSSITNYNNMTGVYVCGGNKIVKFYPLIIEGRDNDYSVANEGEILNTNNRGKIEVNNERMSTLKVYDNIIEKPKEVYEGQILR